MSTDTQENKSFTRVVRKIKCAAMINSLAKSWQGWAIDRSIQQDVIPSGWVPDSIIEDVENKEKSEIKLQVSPRVVTVDAGEDLGESCIKTVAVTKRVAPRLNECGSEWVSSIKEKINSNQMEPPEGSKPFLGNESPTRRRYCSSKAGGMAKVPGQAGREERKMGSRSSSLDTEDSGIGEEMGHSDQNETEQKKPEQKKPITRPQVKVTTMSDIKNRWQKWSKEQVESQKLNPFSGEFDYDHAMACRLQKGDAGYGRPKDGSKTAERGDRANKHIHKEMEEMCFIIRDMDMTDKNGRFYISFGRLFDRYVKISDKVVGILLRCRKHKMLDFKGEMLWKGQDDHVIITLMDTEAVKV